MSDDRWPDRVRGAFRLRTGRRLRVEQIAREIGARRRAEVAEPDTQQPERAPLAGMIEEQETKGLSGLPGIGPATAERIVAKLRRKIEPDPKHPVYLVTIRGEGYKLLEKPA